MKRPASVAAGAAEDEGVAVRAPAAVAVPGQVRGPHHQHDLPVRAQDPAPDRTDPAPDQEVDAPAISQMGVAACSAPAADSEAVAGKVPAHYQRQGAGPGLEAVIGQAVG